MSANSVHPLYTEMSDRWELGNDSYDGEKEIKEKGSEYLPPTSGQIEDGATTNGSSTGAYAYAAYKQRSVYPDIYREAVEAAIGIMHKEPPKIDLPAVLEPMRDNATLLGEPLEMVLRKINARQLITGRLGLLGDIRSDDGEARPIIVIYNELAIRNWDDTSINDEDVDVRLVVLDESGYEMDESFSWVMKDKYRILGLVDDEGKLSSDGTYGTSVLDDTADFSAMELESPNLTGTTLEKIPFVFVNANDLSPTPDIPPLDGLARSCLAIYRGEADYRQNLFMQGQDTLVTIGSQADPDDAMRTGAGARINVVMGGDAKYIGVNSNGLPEQRQGLENDYARALQKSGQIVDSTSSAKESGDALRIRVAAQTATLVQIAITGAAGLERILRAHAVWFGANPDDVSVTPNFNFSEKEMKGQALVEIMQAKGLGAPISEESIHEILQKNGMTELTYEDELNLISQEDPIGAAIPSPIDQPPEG